MQDKSHLDQLITRKATGVHLKYLFFWGHRAHADGSLGKECFSQWYPASFVVDGQNYSSAEHYMMAEKARLFGDHDTLARILAATTPGEAKQLGRSVRHFAEDLWNAHRFAIVTKGSLAKFSQNLPLKAFILATGDRILVEASPVDPVWGIGLAADNPDAQDPDKWQGLNLLGFALMSAREQLIAAA